MSVLRTGTHGTITHGNVSLKGTLMGFSFGSEFGPDRMTVEIDHGGGEVDFPAHWTWHEDPKPQNVLKIGTRVQRVDCDGLAYLMASSTGTDTIGNWVNLHSGRMGEMTPYWLKMFSNPDYYRVVSD